jgi:hypothetical protein
MEKMKEIWKDVKDPIFKDYYQVSNFGRLKTKDRQVIRGGNKNRYSYWKMSRIVSLRRSKENPHLFASLYANEVVNNRTKYVHKLVAEVFLKKPSEQHIFVTHIDGNYDNNAVSNLRWITASENSKSNIEKYPENGLNLKNHNEKIGYYESLKHEVWKKKNVKKVSKMRKWGVSTKEIARVFECSQATIYNVLKKNEEKWKI